jgi:hypothetical protein
LWSGFDFGVALKEFMDCFGGRGGVLSGHDGGRLQRYEIFLEIRMITSFGLTLYVEGKTLFIIHY